MYEANNRTIFRPSLVQCLHNLMSQISIGKEKQIMEQLEKEKKINHALKYVGKIDHF